MGHLRSAGARYASHWQDYPDDLEQIINGVVLGSMYALIAQGYTLVFGVLDKLNFAHGEIFMLGGFICVASIALGASLPIAILVTAIVAGLLGLLVEFVGFRKFQSPDAHLTAALSSFAIGLVIIDLSQKGVGRGIRRSHAAGHSANRDCQYRRN